MSWDELSINNLDTNLVEEAQESLMQIVEGVLPTLDVRRGALRGQLISPLAMLLAAQQDLANRVVDAQSLLNIFNNDELVDNDLVDSLLSNYGIERIIATRASGNILIISDTLLSVTISAGTEFYTDDGVYLTVPNTIHGRVNENQVLTDSDVLITTRVDGTYSLLVPAEAVRTGASGNLVAQTLLQTDSNITGFVTAYTHETFTGGTVDETNTALLNRLVTGITVKTFNNRGTLLGFLREQFPDVAAVSVIGAGDVEMTRDQRGLLPISTGGKVDVYVRSASYPELKIITVTAEVVSIGVDSSNWEFTLGSQAPGFYEVESIKLHNSSEPSFEIFGITPDLDLSKDYYIPDLEEIIEGYFSPFQTQTIEFIDTETNVAGLTVGDTASYDVVVSVLPDIEAIHKYLTARSVRPPATDILVKAVVPCYVEITLTINTIAGTTIDSVEVKEAIINKINSKTTGASLKASEITSAISNLLPSGSFVSDIYMEGRVYQPSGFEVFIDSDTELVLPDEPALYSTRRTTALFANIADINLTINEEDLEE